MQEALTSLEGQLHQWGYLYAGPASLYTLTWDEIFRLVDFRDMQGGNFITDSTLNRFQKYENKLRGTA